MKLLVTGGAGYIGSALCHYLSPRHQVDTVDLLWRGGTATFIDDFGNLKSEFLAAYDAVIHLAGHSSVAAAREQPYAAFYNNVISFSKLLHRLRGQKLLYASSSSVYSAQNGNMYDFSKRTCDDLADILYPNHYALRFGTVCGVSPNMRQDLMVNAMVKSAKETGKILVRNSKVRRPILGMRDLCRSVEALLDGSAVPGIYNLASFVSTVGEIAEQIAQVGQWQIECTPDTPTYDFTMDISHVVEVTDTVDSLTLELINAL